VTVGVMAAAKLLSSVEPIIRSQRGGFRGAETPTPGSVRYALGWRARQDALPRLADLRAAGEARAWLAGQAGSTPRRPKGLSTGCTAKNRMPRVGALSRSGAPSSLILIAVGLVAKPVSLYVADAFQVTAKRDSRLGETVLAEQKTLTTPRL
jgi:hypothetical protein